MIAISIIFARLKPVLLILSCYSNIVLCQDCFDCSDTPFLENKYPSVLNSKYHLLQIFGDASYMTTNYYEKGYNGIAALGENRLFYPRVSEMLHLPLPDPYFICVVKGVKSIDQENRSEYGIGVEWRPFKFCTASGNIFYENMKHTRFYVVYLKVHYFKYLPGWKYIPEDDFRAGIELYRECNIYNRNIIWSEYWGDLSWRRTNFLVDDYTSFRFSLVPKIGFKLFPDSFYSLMPYFTGELTMSEKEYPWENRLVLGAGLRFMPFRYLSNWTSDFLRSMRFYIEAGKIVKYFRNSAEPESPSENIRAGITYAINRW